MALPTSTLVPSAQTALNNAKFGNLSGSLGSTMGFQTSTPQTNSTPGFLASLGKVIAPNPYPNYGQTTQSTAQPTFPGAASSILAKPQDQPLVSSTIGQPPPNPNPNGTLPVTADQTFGVTDAQKAAAAQMNGTNTGGLAPQANQQSSQQTQSTDTSGTPTGARIATNLLNSTNTNTGTYQNLNQQISDLAKKFADQEANLTQGYSGIGSDATSARLQQLEQFKNSAIGAIENEQSKLSQFQTQAQGASQIAGNLVTGTVSTPYGSPIYNPATGQFITPGGVSSGGSSGSGNGGFSPSYNPTQDAQTFGDAVMNNKMTYDQAVSSMGYSSIGKNTLDQYILSKGGNPTQLQAQGSGQQSVLQSIPALQSANTAAKGIQNTITSYLQANPQINSSPLAISNAAQQWVQGKQLTDPTYQTFFNYLNEYTNTLAPILGVGGSPTNLKTQIAQGFINAQASGQSISQVLQSMGTLADQKIQNLQSGATGGGVVTGSGGSGGSSVSGFGWDGNG